MGYILTNGVAILVATAAGLLVGAAYLRARGGPARPTIGFVLTAFVAEAWLASILAGALILAPPEAGAWTMAIGSAVVIWIGFVLPTLMVTSLSQGRPVAEGALNAGHWLAVMVVQAAVLQGMGLVKPA